MAITKETQIGKIEVVGKYKSVQVRTDTVVLEDDVELTRKYHRHVLSSGTIDDNNDFVDTDISGEHTDIQAVCNAVWTDAVKLAWKNQLISQL